MRAEAGVRAMMAAQAHRGPDDAGLKTLTLADGSLVLGHRRLSILDLSPAGHQPMENPETGDWVVFNGEIYNYPELRADLEKLGARFRSRCDTEVILHAYAHWGPAAFDRLFGMFAIGLFVQQTRQLILARDPVGIKPLYYAWGPDSFVFASELRAIRASGLVDTTLDPRAVACLLAHGSVASPLTMWRGVRRLEPGVWAALDLRREESSRQRLDVVRYWDFPEPNREPTPEMHEEIGDLLKCSVQSHLISDVPVGIFLSSGMDSTAVAALSSEGGAAEVDTFTVSLADDPRLDENPIAERSARAIGARHHAVYLAEPEVRRAVQDWLHCLDQPSVDGLNTYIISQAVRERGIVVALSGLGGDEVFGG
ncbi:MAG: asparagine synthase (glutamine-hydrolyzing), partial [Planctomycetes bacterium]|nr:asparagine synthase (glutamine-hydrolyzing) [Planctomycetota bacterium]